MIYAPAGTSSIYFSFAKPRTQIPLASFILFEENFLLGTISEKKYRRRSRRMFLFINLQLRVDEIYCAVKPRTVKNSLSLFSFMENHKNNTIIYICFYEQPEKRGRRKKRNFFFVPNINSHEGWRKFPFVKIPFHSYIVPFHAAGKTFLLRFF